MEDNNIQRPTTSGKPRKRRLSSTAICGALRGNKQPCQREAGWGTEHVGAGPCRSHDTGWVHARGEKKAEYARPLLTQLTGLNIDVNPMDALLMCVRISAAEVAYFSEKISLLKDDEVMHQEVFQQTTVSQNGDSKPSKRVTKTERGKVLNMWIKARKDSLNDLARFSKMALDAGVDERMVRLHEDMGDKLANMIRGVLEELQLSVEQNEAAPQIVRKHLKLISEG